jgi:ABC-type branched-subunit amino acid transport system permease subunit
VATLAFGLLVQHLLFGTGLMFGNRGFRSAGRPVLPLLDGHTDTGFYYVVLAVVVSGGVFAVGVTRSRLGRFLRGLRDAPVAMVAHGLDVALTRLQIFAIASFLAAVAGALLVTQFGQVSGDAFGPFQSLLWLAVLMVSGRRLIASPAVAAGLLVVVPAYLPAGLVPYQPMVFGFLAAAIAVLWAKPPVWPSGEDRRARSPVRDRQTATRRPASVPTTALAEQRR